MQAPPEGAKSGLKPRQVRMRQQTAAYMHLAVLGAARPRRDAFVRVQQAGWVESPLDGVKRIAFFGRELHAHGIDLFDADTVLARHRAAQFDAGLKDVGAERLRPVPLVQIVTVEE